ncbi:Tetratricopeptide-like helical [Cordyceps fumosorosea ARSEF 2679]|uniref:Tetratricopeptide-like helical n=1 Tax=Cordyceps fumosorosea (strain ARSEF 2679) TaxID=1081104 RepID=A0A167PZR3_CORFA|nr:Tetratricopeptide-like helical [Cordyceps fumosorosea ARSEF 2679]OAA57162.1 Tetratricopeptide-like helical [Cordyceps fumosorosea ARSEF 2679]
MSNSQLYLEHVLNLRNQYNIDRRSLVPTLDFVKLLGSLARFLLDSAFYKKAENTELIAREAFQELCEEDERVSADLNILQALSLAHQGSFSRAKGLLDETYLYTLANAFPPAELQLSRAFTIMGNVEASLGNIVSMRWHAKAIKQRLDGYRREPPKRDDEHAAIPLLEKVQANLGRFFFGDSDDLDDRDEVGLSPVVALAYASDSRYWVMRAYEHFRLGNLARRVEEFEKAHEEYANARQLWRHGTRLDTHHFHGACLYKLGCVACDRCEFESARFVIFDTDAQNAYKI